MPYKRNPYTGKKDYYDRWSINVKEAGAKGDGVTDDTAAIVAALATSNVVLCPAGTYNHTGFTLYTDKSILGEGQGVTVLDYTSATGDGITLAAVAPSTTHRRSRIKDVQLANSGDTTGWGITCTVGQEQADIEIGPIWVQGYDHGINIIYPSQGIIKTPRIDGNGKTVVGSTGMIIGTTPNKALNLYVQAPYISSFETAYIAYGYNVVLEKPIWEACITGVKVYGYVKIRSPYAAADTDDVYVYNNGGYGNLVLDGYINQNGGANLLTYETTAVQDRSIVIPMSFGTSHTARIGPHNVSVSQINTNSKVRANRATSAQSLTDNTWTQIALNNATINELSEFAAGTGITTILTTGYYLIGGHIQFAAPADGKRLSAAIYVEGAAVAYSEAINGAAAGYPTVSVSDLRFLTAGDTVELYGRQITGGALDVGFGETATYLYIMRIL